MKAAVVIVSYNPDERLMKSLENLNQMESVALVVVVDNGSLDNSYLEKCSEIACAEIIKYRNNKGIAYAQNEGINLCRKRGFKWVLTLDHDTIIKEVLIKKYLEYIDKYDTSNIGILCSDFYDIGAKKDEIGNTSPQEISLAISSGSFLNLNVFEKMAGFKEHYFIDQVDNEYCYRIRKYGYKILALPGADMEHRLGNIERKCFLGKSFYVYNQAPLRTFYRTRNTIYFMREHPDKVLVKEKIRALFIDFMKLIIETNSLKKIGCYAKGLYHGIADKLPK